MFRPFFLFLIAFFLYSQGFAVDTTYILKYAHHFTSPKIVTPSYNLIKRETNKANWCFDEIIDKRSDKNFSGSTLIWTNKINWIQFISNEKMKSIFSNSSSNTDCEHKILLVINKFLFFDSDSKIDDKDDKVVEARESVSDFGILKLKINFHTYLSNNDTLLPIAIIDTVLRCNTNSVNTTSKIDKLITDAVILVNTIFEKNISTESNKHRNRISRSKVYKAYNNSDFSSNYNKFKEAKIGVYNSYQDFLDNKPMSTLFEIEMDKQELYHLYITNNSSKYLSRKTWGVFDGKQIWKNEDGILQPMFKINNNYYWLSRKLKRKEGMSIPIPIDGFNAGSRIISAPTSKIIFKEAVNHLDFSTGESD